MTRRPFPNYLASTIRLTDLAGSGGDGPANRDHTGRSERGATSRMAERPVTEPLFAACWRLRCCWKVVPGAGRDVERHDPTNAARLGASLQRPSAWRVCVRGPVRAVRRLLTTARMEELREIVAQGPGLRNGTWWCDWRCADLREEIAARLSVTVCEQTVGRWLRRLGMTRLQPRPVHPKKDPEAEADF